MLLFFLGCCQEPVAPIRQARVQDEPKVDPVPTPISPEAHIRLLAESEELWPVLEKVWKEIGYRSINVSYDILEDGSVEECQLKNMGSQERLTPLLSRELADELCRALSKRRYYPPGVRVKAEINVGSPHP